MFAGLLGIFIGGGQALQTAVNSRLRGYLGSPFYASLISFSGGTLCLALVALLSGQSLWISATTWANTPFWLWIGGSLGVIVLTSNILLFPRLGSMQTALMPILGQVLMGVLIDHFGWFGAPQQSFGLTRLGGVILVLAGIFITVVLPNLRQAQNTVASGLWGWRVLGVLAGGLSATQTAMNGTLGRLLDSAILAAFVSFFLGALCLILLVALKEGRWQRLPQALQAGMPIWCIGGGCLGAFFITGSVILVPLIGTGLTVLVSLLGLIGGSLLIDQFGLLGSPRKRIYAVQWLGLCILLGGIALVRLG